MFRNCFLREANEKLALVDNKLNHKELRDSINKEVKRITEKEELILLVGL